MTQQFCIWKFDGEGRGRFRLTRKRVSGTGPTNVCRQSAGYSLHQSSIFADMPVFVKMSRPLLLPANMSEIQLSGLLSLNT